MDWDSPRSMLDFSLCNLERHFLASTNVNKIKTNKLGGFRQCLASIQSVRTKANGNWRLSGVHFHSHVSWEPKWERERRDNEGMGKRFLGEASHNRGLWIKGQASRGAGARGHRGLYTPTWDACSSPTEPRACLERTCLRQTRCSTSGDKEWVQWSTSHHCPLIENY